MNTISYTIFSIYFIFSLYFFYKFLKAKYDLSQTIILIKSDLKKIFKCCINKKNIEEKISKEKADELEKLVNELNGDCKEPFGVPLDVCLSGDLSKEEIEIRERVIKILNKKDLSVRNGGKDKLIVPMEAILFLTKNLNPLVSEKGEITIKVTSEMNNFKDIGQNKVDFDEKDLVEQLVIKMKDKDSILYQDDKDFVNMINSLIISGYDNKEQNKETDIKLNNIEEQKNNSKENINKNEIILENKNIKEEENEVLYPDTINGPDEDLIENKIIEVETKKHNNFNEDIPFVPEKKQKEEKTVILKSSPFDNDDEIMDFNSFEETSFGGNSDNFDINDLLMKELESIELEEDETETTENFYKKLDYKIIDNCTLDFENIEESIKNLFKRNEAIPYLFKNMAKAKPILFNPNKTVSIIDQNILLFAIAKMFGMDSKSYIEGFKKLGKDRLKEVNAILTNKLDIYLSDLLSGEKRPTFYLIKDREDNLYFTFAFVFQTNAFKNAFNSEDFDYFRSFPYTSEYDFIKKATKDETNNASQLIIDIKDVEIL